MAPRSLSVAAIQLAAHTRASFARAWPGIAERIEAAASGAQLIVLPEGTLPAYVLGYEPYTTREIEAALSRCADIARRHTAVIVIGAAREVEGHVYNSAVVIDSDGSVAGTADKHFLWDFDRQWFAPAEQIAPVRTSIGKIGALVCADGRIPTIARTLVDRGAELLVMPTAWVTSGRDPKNLENAQADLLARVRAKENGVPFIAANKCGVELGFVAYCGKSQIVGADGKIAALAPEDRAQTLLAAIELDQAKPFRAAAQPSEPSNAPATITRIAITARPEQQRDGVMRILQ